MIKRASFFIILLFFFICCKTDSQSQLPDSSLNYVEAAPVHKLDTMKLNELMGQFDPTKHSDFVEIQIEHADRKGLYLRKKCYNAFVRMFEEAKSDGILLQIRSATRNFDYQAGIWERKWNGQSKVDGMDLSVQIKDPVDRALKILQYSSMPGSSRHHWGTDIDLNAFENSFFESGEGLEIFKWLEQNASRFGFCRPYTEKNEARPDGYNEEKWHWTYMPLSLPYTQAMENQMKDEYLEGFDGAGTAVTIGILKKYILGINQKCKE